MIANSKKVVLFSTPTCHWCTRAKRYFQDNRIRFKEIDVTRDPKGARDMVRMSGQQGVPVILINNKPVVGFDKTKIERLLSQ